MTVSDGQGTTENGQQWEYTEAQRGSKRFIKTHGMRTSRARLLKHLTPKLIESAKEISDALELVSKGWGYALLGIKAAPMYRNAGGGEPSQEHIDWVRRQIGKLHGWELNTKNIDWVHAVKAIEEHGYTAREYASRVGKHHTTIIDWYKRGLNEYGMRHGMDNQL